MAHLLALRPEEARAELARLHPDAEVCVVETAPPVRPVRDATDARAQAKKPKPKSTTENGAVEKRTFHATQPGDWRVIRCRV
ncbi:MAG TPA: hypothetical protein VF719_03355, partial [Abditibacteriaceae bacterium]